MPLVNSNHRLFNRARFNLCAASGQALSCLIKISMRRASNCPMTCHEIHSRHAILQHIVSSARITVFPLDMFSVAYLPENLDIHDSLIVATALLCRDLFSEDAAILTKDQMIRESALVPIIW